MIIGSGLVYGFGVFSGLVLAGLAFLIYLALREKNPIDDELEKATVRAQSIAGRLSTQSDKIRNATETAKQIEPGE